jgi:hypothetical protein
MLTREQERNPHGQKEQKSRNDFRFRQTCLPV